MKYGNDIATAITSLKVTLIEEPDEPKPIGTATTLSKAQDKIYDKQLVEYVKRLVEYSENVKTTYAIVWGQCTDALREKIKSLTTYAGMSTAGAGIQLLMEIRDIVYNKDDDMDPWHSWHKATFDLYSFKQTNAFSNEEYFQKFTNLVDVVEHCGGSLGNVHSLQMEMLKMIAVDPKNPTGDEIKSSIPQSKERFCATMFFLCADTDRYAGLHRHIQNQRFQGIDK